MRKLFLFLSVLISFSTLVSLTHASSGDITIGNKTYTQEQAQKQIVEPLMQRIQKQKIVKTKSRLIALTIRQYTNKKKSAEKQGKTELVQFYAELLSTLGNLQKVTPILTASGAGTKVPETTSVYTINGKSFTMTEAQKKEKERLTIQMMKDLSEMCYNNNEITHYVKTSFRVNAESTYEYYYALKLLSENNYRIEYKPSGEACRRDKYGNMQRIDTGVNDTTEQTGVYGTPEERQQSAIREEINRMWRDGEANQSKSRFIEWIIEQYGADTYAVQYANTLPFNKK